jgi:hypothetical protein
MIKRVIVGDRASGVRAWGCLPAYGRRGLRADRPSEGERQLAVASYQQDQETWDGPEGSSHIK